MHTLEKIARWVLIVLIIVIALIDIPIIIHLIWSDPVGHLHFFD